MAEAVLFDVAGNVLTSLGSLAVQELSLACNAKSELDKLQGTISTIKAVLLDAEERHKNNSHHVKVWLGRLKDVIYEVDDLLDDFSTEVLQLNTMKGNAFTKKVRVFFSKSNQLASSVKMGHRVKALRQKLDVIANDRLQFNFIDRPVESQTEGRRRDQTYSFVNTEEVIGRDDDKREIIELLTGPKPLMKFEVVPIVGIGGLGKTTLAQMVFNDETVKSLFNLRMWVCVSDRFEVQVVVEKILEAATKSSVQQNYSLETLQIKLENAIKDKHYLLVLDDVWNDNADKWCMVKNLLDRGDKGIGRIVVTTRMELVAQITGTTMPYTLKGLSENRSLNLLNQIAFEKQIPTSRHPDPELETIGKKIVELCVGVPLAIKAIGRVLWFKKSKLEWSLVLDHVTRHGTGAEPTLRSSYDHLPSHLKQCFAYCSLFPKDHRIKKHDLVNLWMAQGFIRSETKVETLENVGHDYFMDLLWRSFFQEVEEDDLGNIISCKMHDLMLDLAKSVSGNECSLIKRVNIENVDKNTRHLSLAMEIKSSWEVPVSLLKASKVRTFFLPFSGDIFEANICSIVRSFNCLRMLDLNGSTFEKLPDSICRLKYLRFLDLSRNCEIKELPDCMTRLQKLQTLKLVACENLEKLPRRIGDMASLKHIELDGCYKISHMPRRIGQLTGLKTLDRFVAGGKDEHMGGLSELKTLNSLQGKLEISSLFNAIPEVTATYLNEKLHLELLRLSWTSLSLFKESVDYDMVMQSLKPHPNLKKLEIQGYVRKFPNWLSSLTNVVSIRLVKCAHSEVLPPLEHLPSLKKLHLDNLYDLEHISEEEISTSTTFFTSLEDLTIHECPKLRGWWRRTKQRKGDEDATCFSCLTSLHIEDCPKLTSFPSFPPLKNLNLHKTRVGVLQQTTRTRGVRFFLSPF